MEVINTPVSPYIQNAPIAYCRATKESIFVDPGDEIDKLINVRVANINPGGGGFGNPLERSVDKVIMDVKNGLVSKEGAKEDYGVVFKDQDFN